MVVLDILKENHRALFFLIAHLSYLEFLTNMDNCGYEEDSAAFKHHTIDLTLPDAFQVNESTRASLSGSLIGLKSEQLERDHEMPTKIQNPTKQLFVEHRVSSSEDLVI